MTPIKLDHTLAEAFKKFDLIAGVGSEATNEACAMTMLSWICGEEWSDHPPCAHRLIADIVVRANDANGATPEMRRELVRAGRTGVLDTWWVPTEVVVETLNGEDQAPFAVAKRVLSGVSSWKKTKERPDLTGTDLTGANLTGANLTGAYLTGAYLTRANLTEANLMWANLTGAYLTKADLTGANFAGTNLTGARGTPYGGMPSGWKLQNKLWTET